MRQTHRSNGKQYKMGYSSGQKKTEYEIINKNKIEKKQHEVGEVII